MDKRLFLCLARSCRVEYISFRRWTCCQRPERASSLTTTSRATQDFQEAKSVHLVLFGRAKQIGRRSLLEQANLFALYRGSRLEARGLLPAAALFRFKAGVSAPTFCSLVAPERSPPIVSVKGKSMSLKLLGLGRALSSELERSLCRPTLVALWQSLCFVPVPMPVPGANVAASKADRELAPSSI